MRARLLASAMYLIASSGLGAVSIDGVVAAASVSRSTFYKYFASPENLVQELTVEITNDLIRLLEQAVLGRADPAERVDRS